MTLPQLHQEIREAVNLQLNSQPTHGNKETKHEFQGPWRLSLHRQLLSGCKSFRDHCTGQRNTPAAGVSSQAIGVLQALRRGVGMTSKKGRPGTNCRSSRTISTVFISSRTFTPHSTLRTSHSTLHIPDFRLQTPHSTLRTLHSPLHTTLHTTHSRLHTSHSPLSTLHSALHTPHSYPDCHEVPRLLHEMHVCNFTT